MDDRDNKARVPGKILTFEDLEVWRTARQVKNQLYNIAGQLPHHERHNLASQIRRAAVSLTANIAEGYGRFHFKENIQCCRIARGSAYELVDHLITCQDEQYTAAERLGMVRQGLFSVIRLLNGYIRSIGTSAKKSTGEG